MFAKKKNIFLILLLVVGVAALAWAGTIHKLPYGVATPYWYGYSSGAPSTYYLEHPTLTANDQVVVEGVAQTLTNKTLTSPTLTSPTVTGAFTATGLVSATDIADVVRYYQLPLGGFISEVSTTVAADLTASTVPGWAIHNSYPSIDWADGEVSKASITFRMPSDYASGGLFKVLATESAASTDNEIDFDVYINKSGTAFDSAATGQTPVAIAAVTTTPAEVTLTPATDFAALAAGDWVTLRIWRDNTATGTADMQVRGVAFYYTATQ